MGSYEESQEYDVILAGGGTAACIVAGRLAEADPGLSILVVEQGPNNLDDPKIVNPAMFSTHLLPDSKTAIFHKGNREEALNGREPIVPSGGVLGGGSSINFMMYTRVDYDSWKTEGWDSESLIPFAKKLETYHFEGPGFDKSVHGYQGPIHVSNGPYYAKNVQDDVLAGAEAAGIPEIIDLQDFKSNNGFSRWAKYISPDGKRQDTAHRYVHPKMASGNYPKLKLLVEHAVSRVVFEGKRAVGIECRPSGLAGHARDIFIKAKKLVVVSAGALGTPQILERSGVGRKEALEELGIPVVSDLPGVGEDYQDHNLVAHVYKTTAGPRESLDALLGGRLDFATALKEKDPILGWNAVDFAAKIRPTEEEVAELGPEFQELWNRDFKTQTERPLMLLTAVAYCLGDPYIISDSMGSKDHHQYISVVSYTAYPYSRGNIHIVSRDPTTAPSFNTGFLSHPADVKKLIWAYKKQREILRRTNLFAAEAPLTQPKFPEGSRASVIKAHPAGGAYGSQQERRDVPPIEYTAEDDAAIEDFIRANMQTTWHSLGTCRMRPRESGGVVDRHLNVHGTEGLKIADLSICPENVAANTNNTALIVGEKAAWIIGQELGIPVSSGQPQQCK